MCFGWESARETLRLEFTSANLILRLSTNSEKFVADFNPISQASAAILMIASSALFAVVAVHTHIIRFMSTAFTMMPSSLLPCYFRALCGSMCYCITRCLSLLVPIDVN